MTGAWAVSVTREALDSVMDGVTVHLTLRGEPVAALVPLDLAPADESVAPFAVVATTPGEREAELDALAAQFAPETTPESWAEAFGGELE